MPFLLAEILNFLGSTHLFGVGSFSKNFIICLSDEERELTEHDSGSNNMRLSGYVW